MSLSKRSLKLTQLLVLGLGYLAPSASLSASERPLAVDGWPLAETSADRVLLNQDAIMGTYVCPALTRLNLQTGSSELVLLAKLQSDKTRWSMTLKPAQTWWSGKPLEPKDIEAFLKQELPGLVKTIGNDRWTVPSFSVAVDGDGPGAAITVLWEKAPEFGPYILNRLPLSRKGSEGLDCVGSLKPDKDDESLTLEGRVGNKARRFVFNSPRDPAGPGAATPFVSFRFGEEMHPKSWERQIEEELHCPQTLDLPVMTVIAWNPEGAFTKDEQFRKAMTYILPRGALLRAGAGSLGDLVSAPILREHPGYKRSLKVLPYDLKKADAILNQLGLVRSERDGYRRTQNGDFLEIAIATDRRHDSSLLRKVLDDSFRALGMKLRIVNKGEAADGMLAGIGGSWPESDLAPLLHSKRSASVWPWSYQFADLDDAIDSYNLSLTQLKPDFARLEAIHDLVFKKEPFSVLVQHKSCMQYGKGMTSAKVISVRNPDWIRGVLER